MNNNLKELDFLNSAPEPKQPTIDELKAKKLQLQIEILEEKKRQEQLKQRQTIQKMNQKTYRNTTASTNTSINNFQITQPKKKKSSLFYIFLLPFCIAFSPFLILAWILITCTKNIK